MDECNERSKRAGVGATLAALSIMSMGMEEVNRARAYSGLGRTKYVRSRNPQAKANRKKTKAQKKARRKNR